MMFVLPIREGLKKEEVEPTADDFVFYVLNAGNLPRHGISYLST